MWQMYDSIIKLKYVCLYYIYLTLEFINTIRTINGNKKSLISYYRITPYHVKSI